MRDEEYQELCDRLTKEHRELLQQLGYPVPPEGSGASTLRERERGYCGDAKAPQTGNDGYNQALTQYESRFIVGGVIGAAGGDGKAAAAAAAVSRPKDAFEEEMELLAQRQQEEQEVTTYPPAAA